MHRAIPRAAARLGATLRSSGASGSGRCSSCASGAPRTLAPLHAQRCTPLAQRPQPPLQQQQPHRRGISASAAAAVPEGGPAAAAAPAAAGSSSARPAPPLAQSRFCRQCGSPMEVRPPALVRGQQLIHGNSFMACAALRAAEAVPAAGPAVNCRRAASKCPSEKRFQTCNAHLQKKLPPGHPARGRRRMASRVHLLQLRRLLQPKNGEGARGGAAAALPPTLQLIASSLRQQR